MEEIQIITTGSESFVNQNYIPKDKNLLNSSSLIRDYGAPQDVIELHIFDESGLLLTSSYNFQNFQTQITSESSSLFNQIYVDPEIDVQSLGYDAGTFQLRGLAALLCVLKRGIPEK